MQINHSYYINNKELGTTIRMDRIYRYLKGGKSIGVLRSALKKLSRPHKRHRSR